MRLRGGRMRHVVLAGLVVVVASGASLAGVALTSASGTASAQQTILVSTNACAAGWVPPRSGTSLVTVRNTAQRAIFEVSILGANEVDDYGDIEMVAPGTSDQMEVTLPPGGYVVNCESFTGASVYSALVHVSGPAVSDAHPYVPPESAQVEGATIAYQNSLLPYLKQLQRETDTLTSAVASGNLAEARRDWLPAHLEYSRLGAAYDTFGNFNAEINGRPLGLVGGVQSPNWQGFLRLEYGLWHGQSAAELAGVAKALDRSVHGLVRAFPSMEMPVNDLSLRTHEILENALQFEMTGETDEGSNTNLATVWANIAGTELSLHAITPLLRANDPALLASVSSGLTQLSAEFKSYEMPDGTWTPLQSLSTSTREHLDSSLSALLEQLSHIPDLLELPISPESPND